MEYRFYGSDDAAVTAVTDIYPGIRTPYDLYDALNKIWCADTCAPRMRHEWTEENKTLGQCSITAFLVQDIFGGRVYGVPRSGGTFHCYNVVDGHTFDLTSEQFGDEELVYEGNPEQLREDHFLKEEKHERYLYLKAELHKKLKKLSMFGLIDSAAKGSIDAAEKLALGYYNGDFGEKNTAKAKKWASYAVKHGSSAAADLLLLLK